MLAQTTCYTVYGLLATMIQCIIMCFYTLTSLLENRIALMPKCSRGFVLVVLPGL